MRSLLAPALDSKALCWGFFLVGVPLSVFTLWALHAALLLVPIERPWILVGLLWAAWDVWSQFIDAAFRLRRHLRDIDADRRKAVGA